MTPAQSQEFSYRLNSCEFSYAVGDTVRQRTLVSLHRVQDGYEVHADVPVEVNIGSETHKLTAAELSENPAAKPPQ